VQPSKPRNPVRKLTSKPRKPVRKCAIAGRRCPAKCCHGLKCFGRSSEVRRCKQCSKITYNCRKTKDCCILEPGAVSICVDGMCCKNTGSTCSTGARCCSKKCSNGLCV
jgi:hypothetical protein